jgi:hypothetical protein
MTPIANATAPTSPPATFTSAAAPAYGATVVLAAAGGAPADEAWICLVSQR